MGIRDSPYTGFFGQLKKTDREIIEQSLTAAGIAHKAQNYVSELSDGERQKAMIAKALAQQCPIILLDEPTAFLDVTSRIETMVLLHKLAVEQHKAILLSTHDLDLAIQMGDCLWLQEKGRPMACGTPEDLILSEMCIRDRSNAFYLPDAIVRKQYIDLNADYAMPLNNTIKIWRKAGNSNEYLFEDNADASGVQSTTGQKISKTLGYLGIENKGVTAEAAAIYVDEVLASKDLSLIHILSIYELTQGYVNVRKLG